MCELKANAGERVEGDDLYHLPGVHLDVYTPLGQKTVHWCQWRKHGSIQTSNPIKHERQGSWTDHGCLVWHWIWRYPPIQPCVGDTTLLALFLVGRETPGQCWLTNVSPKAHTWQACKFGRPIFRQTGPPRQAINPNQNPHTSKSVNINQIATKFWKLKSHLNKQTALTQLPVTNKQPFFGGVVDPPQCWQSFDLETPNAQFQKKYYVSSWTYMFIAKKKMSANICPTLHPTKRWKIPQQIFRRCISYWLWGLLPKTTCLNFARRLQPYSAEVHEIVDPATQMWRETIPRRFIHLHTPWFHRFHKGWNCARPHVLILPIAGETKTWVHPVLSF